MLGKGFSSALRAFNSGVRGWHQPAVRTAKRTCSAAAAGSALGPVFGEGGRAALRLGSAMLGGGAIGVAFGKAQQDEPRGSQDLPLSSTASMPWVQELEARESMQEVLAPSDMLRKHPVGKVLLDKDHLFEGMQTSGQINEFRCFYDSTAKEFHSVVHLGKDVCGFPQTVHGGLTAAIMDETLGGLGVCMWRSGALGFRPPAYTARLEVDYKRKIPAGSVIHCKTHVEKVDDRKIWMRGQVTDGSGVVYASARALFVAPRMRNVLLGWIPGMQKKQ